MLRCALALMFFLLAVPAAAERLTMVEALCVDGPAITLADLLRTEGPRGEALLARFGGEPLLAAPGFEGARAVLSGPKLRELVVNRFGPGLPEIAVPDQVQAQRGGQVFDARLLRPAIDRILTDALAHHEGEVEIREYRFADFLFVADKRPAQIRIAPASAPAPGRISLNLEAVAGDGTVLRKFTGTVFADVWKTMPVAARGLSRGDMLDAGLVGTARKNLARLSRPAWDGRGLPLRMRSSVSEGQVIPADAVEPIPVVTRGQTLTLVYSGRSLTLSVPVESLEDGAVGGIIRLRNMQSRKIVTGRVVDAQTARVP